jgi:hypothetical protein
MTDKSKVEPWKDGRLPKVTCTAKTTMGYPCKKPPIKGGSVCRTHGGAAPQVRRQAQIRILEASDRAAAKLIALMQDKKVPYAVQLAAARDLLDRANLAGKQEMDITLRPQTGFEKSMAGAEIMMDLIEERDFDPNVIDAEIVDEAAAFRGRMAELPEAEQNRARRAHAEQQRQSETPPPKHVRRRSQPPVPVTYPSDSAEAHEAHKAVRRAGADRNEGNPPARIRKSFDQSQQKRR